MKWAKTESGGWSDVDQAVPWKHILQHQLDVYLMSCFLYYHSDYQPVLSDELHDATERLLQSHLRELPDWFRLQISDNNIKSSAHAITIPEDIQEKAIRWAKRKQRE